MRQRILILFQLLVFIFAGPFCFLMGLISTKRKLVIGTIETANTINLLSKVFPESFTVNFITNPFYRSNTYTFGPYGFLAPLIKPLVFANLIPRARVFFYIWSAGFFSYRKVDFIILKFFKKKIITLFCGDDIRSPNSYRELANEMVGDCFVNYLISSSTYGSVAYERKQRATGEEAIKYSDLILNYPVDNLSSVGKIGVPFPYIIDENTYTPQNSKFKNVNELIIVHAPSNNVVKGTPLVRAAIKKLRIDGYKFKYIEIMNKPNEYVNKILSESHILLNQFYGFAPGLLGIEGMLMQNVVLMSADPEIESFPDGFSEGYVKTRYWEVYDNLKFLLDNPHLLEQKAVKAREFVLAHYSISKATERYQKILTENHIAI